MLSTESSQPKPKLPIAEPRESAFRRPAIRPRQPSLASLDRADDEGMLGPPTITTDLAS